MHPPFIDSSDDNILLQTSTICFEFIDDLKQHSIDSLLHDTPNIVKWTKMRAIGDTYLMR